MTLQEIVERIKQEAMMIADSESAGQLQDSEVAIELILPRCLEIVARDAAKDPEQIATLRAEHVLTFVGGNATLPDSIKEEHMESIYFVGAADHFIEPVSLRKQWTDYSMYQPTLTPIFTIRDKKVFYREANGAINSFAGAKTINAVTIPSLPTAYTDELSIKGNLLEKVIALAAQVVAKKLPLPVLDFA